jgi:hypothetical protein
MRERLDELNGEEKITLIAILLIFTQQKETGREGNQKSYLLTTTQRLLHTCIVTYLSSLSISQSGDHCMKKKLLNLPETRLVWALSQASSSSEGGVDSKNVRLCTWKTLNAWKR